MLNFMGIGSAFNLEEDSNGAYFVNNNSLFVIDSGETTLSYLYKAVDFNKYDSINYLITHLHNDHIGSLGSTISYLYLQLNIKVNLIHPLDTVVELLDLMGIRRSMYNFYKTSSYNLNAVTVNFVKTMHVDIMECFGLLISINNETIYYSGDANMIPKMILDKFINREINELYQDTCLSIESAKGHLHYKELLKLIPRKLLDKVYCMHLEPNSIEVFEKVGLNCVKVKSID